MGTDGVELFDVASCIEEIPAGRRTVSFLTSATCEAVASAPPAAGRGGEVGELSGRASSFQIRSPMILVSANTNANSTANPIATSGLITATHAHPPSNATIKTQRINPGNGSGRSFNGICE